MPICQCSRFFSFPLIITTSPTLILKVLSLCFTFCFLLRATRYSCFRRFHKASLHRLIYLCRFFLVSLCFSWGAASGKFTSRPRIKLFGIKIGSSISSSIKFNGLLLSIISISSKTSSNKAHVNCAFPCLL